MKIYNINCKLVDTDINISDSFRKLVESIELDENFSSYNNVNEKTKLIDFICSNYEKRFLDTIAVFTDLKKLESFRITDCWVQIKNIGYTFMVQIIRSYLLCGM